ncbi:MAG: universal stress protein [Gammaproteobacteria bacterium]|nr:MAG: universal stress protein [Gammaproteobacteria bacterium]
MQYQDIVVHIDDGEAMPGRLAVALELAERFGAHLTGVYVDAGLALPTLIDVPVSPNIIEELEDEHRQRCDRAEQQFKSSVDRSEASSEWRLARGEPAGTLSRHARYADLVILGQEGAEDQKMVIGGLPDSVILTCGRPALVVPYIGARRPPGKHAIVAWNGSREAARAVNDALPLLVAADRVEVMCVNPRGADPDDTDLSGADLCRHLGRHGVEAEAQELVAGDLEVGDLLLSRAADYDADFIVMGAYGRSRWREVVLGGVTRQLLNQMTVPVFMSH